MASDKQEEPDSDPDVEVVEELDVVDEVRQRGARQLRAGRLTRLNDRIAGGPARPGEQQISRSPFILSMVFFILGLGIIAAVFFFLLRGESERTRYEQAERAYTEARYNEAIELLESYLLAYPSGEYAHKAHINRGNARVRRYTDSTTFTVDSVIQAEESLTDFVTRCRDFPEYADEADRLIGYSEKIARAAAEVAANVASEEALDVSKKAFARLDNLTTGGGLSVEARERILKLQAKASSEILKRDVLSSSVAEIEAKLDANQPLAALKIYRGLIDRYEILRDDADYRKILNNIRECELGIITTEELNRDAETAEQQKMERPSLSVNLRTQASSDNVTQNKLVFGTGGDTVYAIDSETGDPRWKRRIGAKPPFAPLKVEAAPPGLLLFHSARNELQLVKQEDGTLLWRQSIEAPLTGQPLVVDQEIYVTTSAGVLWQLSLATGRANMRVTFSQPVQGPPALGRDSETLVIPGHEAFVYTLSRRPLKCRAVSWTNHGPGDVKAPMVQVGKLFVMCENHNVEDSRLVALAIADNGELTVRERQGVVGQINEPALIRGAELFIASTPQRLTAFRVSDEPDEDVFHLIDTSQLESAEEGAMYLMSGTGGYVWMASTSLRRFQVTPQAVLLDNAAVAPGEHQYAMQTDDRSLMVTTREPWSSSVFFTRVDRTSMDGQWRFALNTNFVAVGPSAQGTSLLAISDFGKLFQIPLRPVTEPEFFTKEVGEFRLPEDLTDPVSGLTLPDGRLCAWCLGDNATVWTTTRTGRLEQPWRLPAAPETTPAPLAGGLVVPMPGRLRLTARRQKAEDYLLSQESGDKSTWKSLTPLSDTRLLAINSANQLIQVEFRDSPAPHLAEVSVASLNGMTELPPAANADYVCVALIDGRLQLLRSHTLEVVTENDLGNDITGPPLIVGDRLFLELGGSQLQTFAVDEQLTPLQSFETPPGSLIDPPLALPDGQFLAAFSDGTIIRLDHDGAPVTDPVELGQQLQHGPLKSGDSTIVVTTDGSLYFVNDLVEAQ